MRPLSEPSYDFKIDQITKIIIYPMLSADSRFWLVNNREM